MRRPASLLALAVLLVSVVAPLADACPCREAEAQASHSCCEETVLRALTPGCCAVLEAAALPTSVMEPAPSSPVGVLVATLETPGLSAGPATVGAPHSPPRSVPSPPAVLRL